MTRHRQQFARDGASFAFNHPRHRKIVGQLDRLARVNAEREPCPHCGLMILPTGMQRHIDIVHEEDQ